MILQILCLLNRYHVRSRSDRVYNRRTIFVDIWNQMCFYSLTLGQIKMVCSLVFLYNNAKSMVIVWIFYQKVVVDIKLNAFHRKVLLLVLKTSYPTISTTRYQLKKRKILWIKKIPPRLLSKSCHT